MISVFFIVSLVLSTAEIVLTLRLLLLLLLLLLVVIPSSQILISVEIQIRETPLLEYLHQPGHI